MTQYQCPVCGYILSGDIKDLITTVKSCPVCSTHIDLFKETKVETNQNTEGSYLSEWERKSETTEPYMEDIHKIAKENKSIIEAMNLTLPVISFDEILIKGAQLAKLPLEKTDSVNTTTVIGKNARQPLVIETPIIISHMSFGALSKEAKTALAKGSAMQKTAICSGEGGILKEEKDNSYKYIYEYVPNKYSFTEENLKTSDAIEIKIGQGTKPGMGGHLPGSKVTEEIAQIRGFNIGEDITSPSKFKEIKTKEDLLSTVNKLRELSQGRPIGIKLAAENIEKDLEFALFAKPDFVTFDGRGGATGASGKFVKEATSVPTLFALYRARKYLNENSDGSVSLIITGGLRTSKDIIKALAMGADAVAIASAALMAIGCQRYRICDSGLCPVGIATQDIELRKRFNIEKSALMLSNFLEITTNELRDFARLTGNNNVHKLCTDDLTTVNSEISHYTNIKHV